MDKEKSKEGVNLILESIGEDCTREGLIETPEITANLNKINNILNSAIYKEYLNKLSYYEKDRIYCKHDIQHFLDLSRIAYLMVLEKNLNYSKEVIYAIGFLHDIGRVLQYEDNLPHEQGSVILAEKILKDSDFTYEEVREIIKAIRWHKEYENSELGEIIYISDKLSRQCFICNAKETCYWPEEKKNNIIIY